MEGRSLLRPYVFPVGSGNASARERSRALCTSVSGPESARVRRAPSYVSLRRGAWPKPFH